jgi:glycosyltransferase involved in cell wall biosynthesis
MSSRAGLASAPHGVVKVVWPVAKAVAGTIALPVLTLLAAAEGIRTRWRRWRGAGPRLLWGPSPVVAIRDWSRAVGALGYDSVTFAHHVAHINRREDFDVHRDQFLRGVPRTDVIRDFLVFAWALRRADVFLFYFDGGYLRGTALRSLECPLLRLAGKKVVLFPYGGDIAVVGELGIAEEPLLRDYPELVSTSDATRRRVLHLCRWADLVIRNYQYGFLPRADVFWPTQIAIDVDHWIPAGSDVPHTEQAARDVVVVHAPNHRGIKATQSLVDAVEQLRAEGVRVRLELLERCPNEEVRAAMRSSDIVADQFIAGYALFAIEGMSTGKPVMSALSWMPDELRNSPGMRTCPIVDTDVSNLAANLRSLVEDHSRRIELGRAGRDYVLQHHAYRPVAQTWSRLIEHVWRGVPLPNELRPG